jgi:hypothetical protein
MRLRPLLMLAALVVGGCQTAPPAFEVPRGQSYSQDKAAVWQRTLAFLGGQGIEVRREDLAAGRIEAELDGFTERGWAWCEPARVVDRSSDSRGIDRARPVDRDLALIVDLEERGGATEVTLEASFTETQIDPFRNLPLTQRCRSTGELERSLLAAI